LILGTYVLNWSISRDDKVKLTNCQNHHHHGGVVDTWTKWAKTQAKRSQGPAGRQCFMSVWPVPSRTRVYTRSGRARQWRKLVEAALPNRLLQVGGAPPPPYKYPPMVEMRRHTPHFGDSTCKAVILSVVARRSLAGSVERLCGPEGLQDYREPSS
jgi:hypothetical protein